MAKLSKFKKKKRLSYMPWLLTGVCPNCLEPLKNNEGHFVPPCFGDAGFFHCNKTEINKDTSPQR
jgi:hypothetical protein